MIQLNTFPLKERRLEMDGCKYGSWCGIRFVSLIMDEQPFVSLTFYFLLSTFISVSN